MNILDYLFEQNLISIEQYWYWKGKKPEDINNISYLFFRKEWLEDILENIVKHLYILWYTWITKPNIKDTLEWEGYITWYRDCIKENRSYSPYIKINSSNKTLDYNYDYMDNKYNELVQFVNRYTYIVVTIQKR